MTGSPQDLIDIRHYLQNATGLQPVALGIQHYSSQGGGYHEGIDLLKQQGRYIGQSNPDYSVRQSPRDRPGTDNASAIDIDMNWRQGETFFRNFTLQLVNACVHGDPRTRDIREIIYSPDGRVVRRWDRLGSSTTGDASHLTHDHLSFFRDSEGRRNRQDNILGLLVELIEGKTGSDPDMFMSAIEGDPTGAIYLCTGREYYQIPDEQTYNWLKSVGLRQQNVPNAAGLARLCGLPGGTWQAAVDKRLSDLSKAVADLAARPATAAAPVDAGSFLAALSDPTVRSWFVDVAREGAEAAEDS